MLYYTLRILGCIIKITYTSHPSLLNFVVKNVKTCILYLVTQIYKKYPNILQIIKILTKNN